MHNCARFYFRNPLNGSAEPRIERGIAVTEHTDSERMTMQVGVLDKPTDPMTYSPKLRILVHTNVRTQGLLQAGRHQERPGDAERAAKPQAYADDVRLLQSGVRSLIVPAEELDQGLLMFVVPEGTTIIPSNGADVAYIWTNFNHQHKQIPARGYYQRPAPNAHGYCQLMVLPHGGKVTVELDGQSYEVTFSAAQGFELSTIDTYGCPQLLRKTY